jgi:hypothetical protein
MVADSKERTRMPWFQRRVPPKIRRYLAEHRRVGPRRVKAKDPNRVIRRQRGELKEWVRGFSPRWSAAASCPESGFGEITPEKSTGVYDQHSFHLDV